MSITFRGKALDYPGFSANSDTTGLFEVNPDTYIELIAFLENQVLQEKVVDHREPLSHFVPLTREELLRFHCPKSLLEGQLHNCYWYKPDLMKDRHIVRYMISFPHWSASLGKNQGSSLWFVALREEQLRDPNFNLFDNVDGLGSIIFDKLEL
ncbi:MAG TPA: hypothetical protein VHZ51_07045, partial [Ktedonobacteraceae bacterium]|nr:hypothetical protein [Ktedonobacteraceae bacterium]